METALDEIMDEFKPRVNDTNTPAELRTTLGHVAKQPQQVTLNNTARMCEPGACQCMGPSKMFSCVRRPFSEEISLHTYDG